MNAYNARASLKVTTGVYIGASEMQWEKVEQRNHNMHAWIHSLAGCMHVNYI